MSQFPDVAGPQVTRQGALCFGAQAVPRVSTSGAGVKQTRCQSEDVFPALAQWWHMQMNNVNAVVQILAKTTLLDHGFEYSKIPLDQALMIPCLRISIYA